MKKLIILLSVCLASYGFAQDKDSLTLSKEQMIEEFDFLIDFLEEVDPHLEIYKKMMDFDVIAELKKIKLQLDTVNNLSSYVSILYNSINLIPEGHTELLLNYNNLSGNKYYKNRYQCFFTDTTERNYNIIMNSLMRRVMSQKNKQKRYRHNSFPLIYLDGKYYSTNSINRKLGDRSIFINCASELKSINETLVDTLGNSYFIDSRSNLKPKWDVKTQKFYSEFLLQKPQFLKSIVKTKLTKPNSNIEEEILFYDSIYSNSIKTYYDCDLCFNSINKDSLMLIENKIYYFDNTLFVKMRSMMDIEYFKTEIPKYKDSIIENVVIDVRNNNGGSDLVWRKVLQLLIDKPIYKTGILGVKNSTYLKDYGFDIDLLSMYKAPILHQEYKLISELKDSIAFIPDSNSIRYNGQIYLLHNENSFSAAGSFVAFALSEEKITAIGRGDVGWLGGYGTDPILVQLPHSKLIFKMHPVIHIPDKPKTIEDYFWNDTEVKVSTNVEFEIKFRIYSQYDIYSEKYLTEEDLYFMKYLEISNN